MYFNDRLLKVVFQMSSGERFIGGHDKNPFALYSDYTIDNKHNYQPLYMMVSYYPQSKIIGPSFIRPGSYFSKDNKIIFLCARPSMTEGFFVTYNHITGSFHQWAENISTRVMIGKEILNIIQDFDLKYLGTVKRILQKGT